MKNSLANSSHSMDEGVDTATLHIPLFPLHTVLFPGGPLPLRIFEPRYLDMISNCMKQGTGFGVCLIQEGQEVGGVATTYDTGTLAHITDWHQRHDGLLGITVTGEQRFTILSREMTRQHLCEARVEMIANEPERAVPVDYLPLCDLLKTLIEQIGHHHAQLPTRYGDASWVGYRLAELLPIDNTQRQFFLQMDDPVQRLERLHRLIAEFRID